MKNWASAFDCLRQRSIAEVSSSAGVSTPFAFDASQDESDVTQFIDSIWADLGNDADIIMSLPGRDMNLVRDTLICATKFFHIIESVQNHINRGAMTWAIVETYHAALLGTRLIAALYGVLSYGVKGRTVLLDYRPEFGREQDRKKFKRENKGLEEPIRIFRPQSHQLSQSEAWDLVKRLCNITSSPPEDKASIDDLKSIALAKNSSYRNMILYDSVAWGWLDDFNRSAIDIEVQHSRLEMVDATHTVSVNALVGIFAFVKPRLITLCENCGVLPVSLSPILGRGASPIDLLG